MDSLNHKEKALACLAQIDPAVLDYGNWLRVGMALKGVGASVENWDAWSQRDPKRYQPDECAAKWFSFHSGGTEGGVGIGTLVMLCRSQGGIPPRGGANRAPRLWSPPRPPRPVIDYEKAKAELIIKGGGFIDPDSAELRNSSPCPLNWGPGLEPPFFLRAMYALDEFIYIGPRNGKGAGHVRTVRDWIAFFESEAVRLAMLDGPAREQAEVDLGWRFPHLIVNPLTGKEGRTKNGTPSLRADACVASFRWFVGECDHLPKGQQLALYRGLGFPCSALIDSGGKSIHALFRVRVRDAAEWNAKVEKGLFPHLTRLGFDSECKNESRMSRLPGVRRIKIDKTGLCEDSGRYQRLLWLAPGGEAIA